MNALPFPRLRYVFMAFLALTVAVFACHSSLSDTPPAPAPGLTITGDPSITQVSPGQLRLDFGTAKLIHIGKALSWTLTIQNTSAATVTLASVTTSCGCTSAVLGTTGDVKLPADIAAKSSLQLGIQINASDLIPGNVRKTVTLTPAAGDPLTLAIVGTILSPATFNREAVGFGVMSPGDQSPVLVTVTVDPAVASVPFQVVADDDDIVVQPMASLAPARPGIEPIRRDYRLTLKTAPRLGPIDGSLNLIPDKTATADGTPFPAISIPVTGSVQTDVTASITEVFFGLVKPGVVRTQNVILRGQDVAAKTITATSSSPILQVTLADADPAANGNPQVTLTVTLPATIGQGEFSAKVTVTTPKGTKFVIPVTAEVSNYAAQ